MAAEFVMPQLGLTMTEGTITRWYKAKGDSVAVGEVLVEVATDKITNQIEANVAGTLLDILAPEGATVPVKTVIGVIGGAGEIYTLAAKVAPSAKIAARIETSAPKREAAAAAISRGCWVKASPLARRLAKNQGIDLAKVTATGPAGRVVERDILAFQAERPKASPLAAKIAAERGVNLAAVPAQGRIMKQDVEAVSAPAVESKAAGRPLSPMRKVIAERLGESWRSAPHVHLTVDADMTAVNELRQRLAAAHGVKFSVTEVIVKCAAQTLLDLPMVNSSLIDNMLIENDAVHIGVAVSVENGLVVPVIRNVHQKTIRRINQEIAEFAAKVQSGRLLPEDYEGGTFTVSNLGMYGVDHFTPVVNPPQSAILAISRIQDKAVVRSGEIVIRPMMSMCLSIDHRVVDGAMGARYMARLREYVEDPLLLV